MTGWYSASTMTIYRRREVEKRHVVVHGWVELARLMKVGESVDVEERYPLADAGRRLGMQFSTEALDDGFRVTRTR